MAELAIGAEFAGYRIEGVAGRGGMGVVYRATQLALDRIVALKLIAPEFTDDVAFRERFKRESHTAAAIEHPHVVPVYEAGEHDGRLFISMRFIEGTDLRALIRMQAMEPARVAEIVRQIAGALDAAHRRGLIHRDVKPANILIASNDGEHAYLTDFGLTKGAASVAGLTQTGQFVGTPDYCAPEQIKGESADARADVYALGCVLFHALAGHEPFPRDSEVAKIYAHLNDPPPSVSSTRPELAPGLDAVIERALAKDREQRYASAGDLGRAAVAAADGPSVPPGAPTVASGGAPPSGSSATTRAVPAAEPPAPTVPSPAPPEPPAATAPSPAPPPSRPSRRGPAIVAGLGAAAAAAVAAVVLLGGGDEDDGGGGFSDRPAPRPARVAATIRVGGTPDGLDTDGDDVLVVDAEGGRLVRIDSRRDAVAGEPTSLGRDPDSIDALDGVAWVTNVEDGTVSRVEDGAQSSEIEVGSRPEGVAIGKQLVWVTNNADGTVSRIDRATPTTVGAPIGVGTRPVDVFIGERFVWVTNEIDGTVTRIDAGTSAIVGEPIQVGSKPRGVVEGLGSVWVTNSGDGTVSRLDPGTGRPVGRPITVGENPREVTIGAGSVWVSNTDSNTVSRIDPARGRIVGSPIPVGRRPLGIAFGSGSVWVANYDAGTVTRIQP